MFYRTENIPSATTSDSLPKIARIFDSFPAAAGEASARSVAGGIPFRFASENGWNVGEPIGEWNCSLFWLPKSVRPDSVEANARQPPGRQRILDPPETTFEE